MPSSPKNVRAVVFDVDGVLTRGDIIYGPDGEWKIFDVQDGHGFTLAKKMGLKTALLTARKSAAVRQRAKDLRVDAFIEGSKNKAEGLRKILAKLRVKPAAACYVGDDLVDLPAMAVAGFPVAVANAVPEVKSRAALVTKRSGGAGAARELIEHILKAQGLWKRAVAAGWEPG
jgi:3-deoxy-D-manno-octulosonate 8-phosphate phosphatase (KDO 8-P phosphatase)